MLVDKIASKRPCRVLELGPAFGANVEFLSQYSSKICIEDLYQTLASVGPLFTGDERTFCPVYETLLPYRADTRFDVILLWDLLDYLEASDIRRLIRHLGRFCQRGTLLYALVSTRQKIPAEPTNFKIVGKDQLLYQCSTTEERDCPRYRQGALLELLRGFRVERSFLLRNGMQEYLFEFV
ncbi:MAG: hypothetical protein FD120_1267 [Gammaproteobacteria bacterium]|nr:MAG: hypothetical protein FD120_1267 [Gammaproteobacteria bacterium]